jgi:hypothetical protein
MYLNELVKLCYTENCQGVFINENFPNICLLLYADDLILCSDTVGRLQKLINTLQKYCKISGMKVNLSKTKVMIFRNGGVLRKNEHLFYQGKEIESTTYYKYLGIMFSSRLKWSKATNTLAAQGKKALFSIKKVIYKCNGIPIEVAFELFDKMILPVVTYAAEVWGYEIYEPIERVQFQFCKFILGVASNTCNSAVLGECGRYPLYIHYYLKCIKYWLKLLEMSNNRLPKAAYIMLHEMDANGKINWVTEVKNLLFKYGFGYVFVMQEVGNIDLFINIFKNRLLDCAFQEWTSNISNISKLTCYSTFKTLLEVEKYLTCIKTRKFKVAFCRFRCSNHSLEIELGRRNNVNIVDRLCKYCCEQGENKIENEYHFICVCNKYKDLRIKYINYAINYTKYEFSQLMKTQNICKLN